MKKNVRWILFNLRERSLIKLYCRKHKRFLRLPIGLRTKIIKRKVDVWFGKNFKRADEEIKQLINNLIFES